MNSTLNLIKLVKGFWLFIAICSIGIFAACSSKDSDPKPDDKEVVEPPANTITVDIDISHQEMIGFGGALTWYCDRITSSSKKNEIAHLLFDDLGLDILRLKNWYYPKDYPNVKSADQMEVDWFKPHFNATKQLYDLGKNINPDLKVLLSSWGPPSALKSNAQLNEGTLSKENGQFVYDAYAQYWVDMLDNVGFDPDYISMQNEPSYVNADWETSEWRPKETTTFPGYEEAAEMVHDLIKDRTNTPMMMGPESANLGQSSFGGNTFSSFADIVKDKDYIGMYAFHPYNFNSSTDLKNTVSALEMVGSYDNKPNIMTEYSGMQWLQTAEFIHNVLVYANASGYIYWTMMWDENSEDAMLRVNASGNYEVTPFFYLMKHFAKHIDMGYIRVDAKSSITSVKTTAFLSPNADKLTLIMVNTSTQSIEMELEGLAESTTSMSVYQSTEEELYQTLGNATDGSITLGGSSISTVVIEF